MDAQDSAVGHVVDTEERQDKVDDRVVVQMEPVGQMVVGTVAVVVEARQVEAVQ